MRQTIELQPAFERQATDLQPHSGIGNIVREKRVILLAQYNAQKNTHVEGRYPAISDPANLQATMEEPVIKRSSDHIDSKRRGQ